MQKTRCFGSCPVYTLEIYENGQVAFHGEENVDMIGDFAASLSKEEYNTLIESFRDSNFFDFEESYTSTVSDLPTTFLLYKEGDKSLRITDYYGAPDKLKQLEKLVEDLVGTLKWKKSIAP